MTRARSGAGATTLILAEWLAPLAVIAVGLVFARSMLARSRCLPRARSTRCAGGPAVRTTPPETV
jgi:hypothetical protein